MKFEMPNVINIVGTPYSYSEKEGTEFDTEMGKVEGYIDFINCEILTAKDVADDRKVVTIMHELVHGIDEAFEIKLNETKTQQLARGLICLFKDNPKLLELFK